MVCSKREDFEGNDGADGSDRENRSPDDAVEIDGSAVGSSEPSDAGLENRIDSSAEVGLTERLRGVLSGEGDNDMLIPHGSAENSILQWLQALDLQVVGACRADERLKPLLKLNVSSGVAEDRLLAQLSQHFEASEVGMLARCLCVPLVSIRVGKVIKRGTLLCPTTARGHLNLTLMPSSDLRLSFVGDDGCTERLTILSTKSDSCEVTIEQITADRSSRSFLIKLPEERVSYFWCSEKSKLIGDELLTKMKDLLRRKPSLAELTGISESRLNCFAIHLHAYLLSSTSATRSDPTILSTTTAHMSTSDLIEADQSTQSSLPSSKPSRSRLTSGHLAKSHSSLCQNSLSPRSNTFKEGLPRNSLSLRSGVRERFRRRGEGSCGSSTVDNSPVASHVTQTSTSGQTENERCSEHSRCCSFLPLNLPETVNTSTPSSRQFSCHYLPFSDVDGLGSPYYCWCPPCTSALQYTVTPHLPVKTVEAVSLPPLSAALSAGRSSSSWVPPTPPLDLSNIPQLDFPSFLPEPLVQFSLPVSSLITMPSSQQIPTFTPLMSDPIVHIPVIDVCSSGQGYLVSAGPAIPTTISPPLPSLVNPHIPDAESVVEKSARETLRLLINSTKSNPPLIEMLPAVLTSTDEDLSFIHGNKVSAVVSGSRGLYSGTKDVYAITSSISAIGLDLHPWSPINRNVTGANVLTENFCEELADGKKDVPSDDDVDGENDLLSNEAQGGSLLP